MSHYVPRGRMADIITLLSLVALAVALSLFQVSAWTVDIEEAGALKIGNAANADAANGE